MPILVRHHSIISDKNVVFNVNTFENGAKKRNIWMVVVDEERDVQEAVDCFC